jgi:hypothetical protein
MYPKPILLSSGFFYTIALEIKHPFQAISMLYDCSKYLQATKFLFSTIKTINEIEYLEVKFDGNSLTRTQFTNLIHHSNIDNDYSKFFLNLKLGSFRLGKTFVFITADQDERKVILFSADSKVTPSFDESYGYFAYI